MLNRDNLYNMRQFVGGLLTGTSGSGLPTFITEASHSPARMEYSRKIIYTLGGLRDCGDCALERREGVSLAPQIYSI